MIMTHKAGFLAACNDKAVKDSEMNDRITQIIALNFCEEEKALYQNQCSSRAGADCRTDWTACYGPVQSTLFGGLP
jgi:hypothetical protein